MRDDPLAGAAAPVEGRAARRRLRAVLLLRAVGDRERRRRDRRVGRHGAGHPGQLSLRRPGAGQRSSTTASTPRSTRPTHVERDAGEVRRRPVPAVGAVPRPHHPAEGPALPAGGGARFDPDAQLVLLRRVAGHAGDRGRGRRRDRRAAGVRVPAWSGSRRWCPSPRPIAVPHRAPACSSARRSTSRWASSTSRRWPARRPSSRRRPAASPRSSPTDPTGILVPIDPDPADPYGAPRDPAAFAAAHRRGRQRAARRPDAGRATMGKAGRRGRVEHFCWAAIAERTRQLYASLLLRAERRRRGAAAMVHLRVRRREPEAAVQARGRRTCAASSAGRRRFLLDHVLHTAMPSPRPRCAATT